MDLDRVIKLEKSFASAVHEIYRSAAELGLSSSEINKRICENIWENDVYKKLPRYAKSFVEGVRHHCEMLQWELVVFSYVVNGKRLTIESEEYRKVDPCYVSENCTDTGAFVYREFPDKLFTQPKHTA
jgi:hypothetical protein